MILFGVLFGWHVWRGESRRRYRFKITLTKNAIPNDVGGVYVFVRRWFVFFLQPLYVGKAANLRGRLVGHEKWPKAFWDLGATERHVMRIALEKDREAIEEDLIRGLKPKMNTVLVPRGPSDPAHHRPVGRGWALRNWFLVKAKTLD